MKITYSVTQIKNRTLNGEGHACIICFPKWSNNIRLWPLYYYSLAPQ
jgi:hypothetical protein